MTSPSARPWTVRVAVVAALGAYFVMAVSGVARKSNTFDEIAHLTSGHAYWTLGDYRLQPENGNWPQRLGALPAVLRGAVPASTQSAAWARGDIWTVGDEFFFDRGNNIDRLLWEGRAIIAVLGVLLGALVFVVARRLTDLSGASVALALFVFSPTMLAHGPQVTSDMAAALGFVGSVVAVWVAIHRATPLTVTVSAGAVSALLLSKFSGVLIAPMIVVLAGIRLFVGRPLVWRTSVGGRWRIERSARRQLRILALVGLVHIVVAMILIWASYGFRYSAFRDFAGNPQFLVAWPQVLGRGLQGDSLIVRAVEWARSMQLLPEAYLYGFSHTMTFAQARPSFLNGVVATTGRLAFFPFAFAVKSTIPFLLLSGSALIAWWRFGSPKRRYAALPLVVLVVVYGGAALTTNLNIGQRHLLPIYPALMILCGASVWWLGDRGATGVLRRIEALALVAVTGWHIAESVRVRPHYLTYFNQLVGGPAEGYRHLVDSSLDWGQDLPAVKAWLDEHRSADEPVYLSYFGTSRPAHFGIDAVALPGFFDRRAPATGEPLQPGLYIYSATMLAGVYASTQGRWGAQEEAQYQQVLAAADVPGAREALEHLRFGRLSAYLRRRPPTAQIANSVLVFRLSSRDLTDALLRPLP